MARAGGARACRGGSAIVGKAVGAAGYLTRAELCSLLPPWPQMPSPSFLGAIRARGETLFRVWAPQAQSVEVVFEESQEPPLALKRDSDGYFTGATSASV